MFPTSCLITKGRDPERQFRDRSVSSSLSYVRWPNPSVTSSHRRCMGILLGLGRSFLCGQ